MNAWLWRWLKRVPRLLEAPRPDPAQHAQRILRLQRDVVLPAKFVVIVVLFYYLYRSTWVDKATNSYGVVLDTMQDFYGVYVLLNLLVAVSFFVVRQFPTGMVQWVVFVLGLADGLLLGGLTLMTNGFDSVLYWVFPGLIVLNAFCIPLATPQLVLNLALSGFFLLAGVLEPDFRNVEQDVPTLRPMRERRPIPRVTAEEIPNPHAMVTRLWRTNDALAKILWSRFHGPVRERLDRLMDEPNSAAELQTLLVDEFNRLLPASRYVTQPSSEPPDNPTEPFLLKLFILWLLTPCCYGVQVLAARQQRAEEEQKEFATRTSQLQSAGRLAAEVAHQLKNPLAIINNTAFSLDRTLRAGKGGNPAQQIQIIQEEVEKADRIITQVMGYAELSEGRVEKLNVLEELDRSIERVFPPGAAYSTEIRRDYDGEFPPLLMQRGHLGETFTNILQNARDVLEGKGHITVTARCRPDDAVEVVIADDGPGIPAEQFERVFEAYYTTRPKGTGLGLAIVKHNVELYGGTVHVESELGKGARFTVVFPAKAATRLSRPS